MNCEADVCILSETHETGAALRLRAAVPDSLGWQIVGSSRTQHRGGGVAILFRRDEFKFHSAKEREDAEVITLTSFRRKLTIIGAYVTNSPHIKTGDELLRMASLRQVRQEVETARERGHRVVLIGDLNLRPTEQQLAELDQHMKKVCTPSFNFGLTVTREIFSLLKS